MAGLRTAVILEAIETLDGHGMPGTVLVQELTADLTNETAFDFADKLNKRVQIVLKYSSGALDREDDEGTEDGENEGTEDGENEVTEDEPNDDSKARIAVVAAEKRRSGKKQLVKDGSPQTVRNVLKKSVDDLLNEIV